MDKNGQTAHPTTKIKLVTTLPQNHQNLNPESYIEPEKITFNNKIESFYPHLPFIISLLFLVFVSLLFLIFVIHTVYWKPPLISQSCQTNSQCHNNQVCQLGYCVEPICNSDKDCSNQSVCLHSYCYNYTCQSSNDCLHLSSDFACIDNICKKTKTSCQSNVDCPNMTCVNNICVQCTSFNNCPVGQGCFNGICRYPTSDSENIKGMINYHSNAQTAENISAPSGYLCSVSSCGQKENNQPIPCGLNQQCPSHCNYCVNGTCRCIAGEIYETCITNKDCSSGLCHNNICVPSGGECLYSYLGSDQKSDVCPQTKPYCVNGICQKNSLGAMCGASYLPDDFCSNPSSLGINPELLSGLPGQTPDNMGLFCVNGKCQSQPGSLNSLCTDGSCQNFNNTNFTCKKSPINPLEFRCLT